MSQKAVVGATGVVNPDAQLEVAGSSWQLRGELRFDTVSELLKKLTAALGVASAGAQLQLDLAGVSRADSAGLALLLETLGIARRSGRSLKIVNAPATLRTLAQISDVETMLLAAQAS